MGIKSSKNTKKDIYRLKIHNLKNQLSLLEKAVNNYKNEASLASESHKSELISALNIINDQEKRLLSIEREYQTMKYCSKELEAIKMELNIMASEHKQTSHNLPSLIKQVGDKEIKSWNDSVLELKERYESAKQYTMELVSMELAHERELQDLQRRIRRLENVESISEVKPNESFIEQYKLIGENVDLNNVNEQASKYDKKFLKLDAAIKKLKDDLILSNFNKKL
ncbi:uncharacterized protein LOC124817760 [Hydra vulgaris]|uniref:Uncharacterized protein LOC124817760 n=1 Tax=Hydra vulgaris TaxID=6087 RepID=A0ABM4D845_HYDVU